MGALGGIVAVLITLFLAQLLLRGLWAAYFGATGQLKPLERKDGGRDDPGRGTTGRDELTRATFKEASGDLCPLHNLSYIGYTTFDLTGRRLSVLGCEECMNEALAHRDFIWSRGNYEAHPEWAGSQLYPHLLGNDTARIGTLFEAFADPNAQELAKTWLQASDARTRIAGIAALRWRQTPGNIALLKDLLTDDEKPKGQSSVGTKAYSMLTFWKFSHAEVHKWEAEARQADGENQSSAV